MENNLPIEVSPKQHLLTVCPFPFKNERVQLVAQPGLSLQEIVDSIDGLPKECAMTVQVSGIPILPESWSTFYPSEGSFIAIRVLPMGGDEGGKNPLRIFLTLAVIVASIATYGALSGTAYAAYAAYAAAAVSMAGTLLVNALCPPAQGNLSDRAGINLDGVVNSITNARNQANPFGPIPVLLGHHKIVPFYGARPYTEIVGNDQYLRLLFVPCYLPVQLSEFKIGETDISEFEGVEIQVKSVSTDDMPDLYTNSIYEETVGIELLEKNPTTLETPNWTKRTTQLETDEIIIDVICPQGLCEIAANGSRSIRSVYYEIQHSVAGKDYWISPWEYEEIATQDIEIPALAYQAGDSIWRIFLNVYTKKFYLVAGIQGYVNDEYSVYTYPLPPVTPDGSCAIAQIYAPYGSTVITDAMITDLRSSNCFDLEVESDFLVSATSPESTSVTIATGSFRKRPFLSAQTTEALRTSHRIKVTQGQYDVRVRRFTEDSTDDRVFDDLYWSILRSVTYESPVTNTNVALIAMRIKATDQLNGIVDTFNCVGMSVCKDWDATTKTWIERSTMNPASLYRYVLQHPANKRAVADAKIDLVKLQEWHEFCQPVSVYMDAGPAVDKGGGKVGLPCANHPFADNETVYIAGTTNYSNSDYYGSMHYGRYTVDKDSTTNEVVIVATFVAEDFTGAESLHDIGLQYNSLIDYQTSISSMLQQIAAAGMASPTYVNGKYSVVIDQEQTTPIQHFTPRNSWGFSGNRTYPKIPHAIRVVFANSLAGWEIDERVVYADGYDAESATLYEQLELPGTTNPELAYVLARYHLATLLLRPEKYSFYADVENLVATRGDLIRVTHDVPLWGIATGRVTGIVQDEAEEYITGIVMDSVMSMSSTKTYSLRLRLADGSSLLLPIEPDDGDFTTLTLVTPILSSGTAVLDQLGMFGETGEESVELLILSIEPGEDLTARITCVDYSPDVYTASADAIGEHDSHITAPYGPVAKIGYPKIYQIRSDESVMFYGPDGVLHTRIVITLEPAGGYLSKIAFTELSVKFYGVDGPWYPLRFDGFMHEIAYADVIPGTEYSVRLRFILHTGEFTPWTTAVQHTIVGKTTPPDMATGFTATDVIGGIRLEWTNPTVIDFYATGVWRAEADSFPGSDAKYVITGAPGEVMSFTDLDVDQDTTYYYWLKSYDTSGNASDETGSVTSEPGKIHSGDIFDAIQSENYESGVSGWYIGFRGDFVGYAEFNDVVVRGSLYAGQIHIPGTATADSFHVDTTGNSWWGCTLADYVSDPENAPAYVKKDGTIKFTGGVIAGWSISDTEISTDTLIIDSDNEQIRTADYTSGYLGTGFLLSADFFEVGNALIRGMIRTSVFQKDTISVVGGSLMILPADTVKVNMTAADNSTLTVMGNETFAVDDILRIKEGGYDEWMIVTNAASAPTYTVTRDLAGSYDPDDNPIWTRGSSVVNWGQDGDGGIYLTSSDANSPYLAVFTHGTSPWSDVVTHLRIGNLNGFLGYATDLFGIAIGDATDYLKYDATNGLNIAGTVTIRSGSSGIANFTDGGFLAAPDGDGLYISSAFMGYYKSGVWTTYIADDGVFAFSGDANNYITWNGTSLVVKGSITVTGGSGIASFSDAGVLKTPGVNGLYASTSFMGFYKDAAWKTYIANDGTFVFMGDANNYVSWNGTSLAVKGNIVVTGGSGIANFTDAGFLAAPSGSGLFISTSYMGYYTGGAWKTYIANNGNFAFAGDANNFVTWNGSTLAIKGTVTATAGVIGSFTIGTYLYTGSKTAFNDTNAGVHIGSDGIGFGNNIFKVSNAGAMTAVLGTVGGWTIDAAKLISTNIGLLSGASAEILLGHATDYAAAKIGFKNDGSGKLASGNISWTAAGALTMNGRWTTTGGLIVNASGGGLNNIICTGGYIGVIGNGTFYGVYGNASSRGIGVKGNSADGVGVKGTGGTYGVEGTGPTAGVRGASAAGIGVLGQGIGYGVKGGASGATSYGVYGDATTAGVYGTATTYGVYGTATTYGLYGTGQYGVVGYGSSYDLYAGTVAGKSYFQGKIGIADLSPSVALDVNGDIYATGTATIAGGADPPYELFWAETRESVVDRIKKNVPENLLNGCAVFYNSEDDRIELFMVSKGEFRDLQNRVLATVDPITSTYPVRDKYFLNPGTGLIESRKVRVEDNVHVLKEGFTLDEYTGDVYDVAKKKVMVSMAVEIHKKIDLGDGSPAVKSVMQKSQTL